MHSTLVSQEAGLLTVGVVGVLSRDDGSRISNVGDVQMPRISHNTHAGRSAESNVDPAGVNFRISMLESVEQGSPYVLEFGVGGQIMVA